MLLIMMMLHFRNAIISYVNHMLKRIHFAVSRARGWTLETFTLRFRKSCPFRCRVPWRHYSSRSELEDDDEGTEKHFQAVVLAGGLTFGKHFLQTSLHGQLVGIPNGDM